jgi:rSAM/selenodomain-associated transferase 1
MRSGARITVIIPALNETQAIARVIGDIPDWVDEVIVADNGSTDDTANVAMSAGARVVREPRRGYGSACLKAMAAMDNPDIVVFLDGDYSDHPAEMDRLVDPIVGGEAELVIGSRVLGECAPGALTLVQRFGNWLACLLVRLVWQVRFTDLGPFRAIRASRLRALDMCDPDYGWTVEMQVKAAQQRLLTQEVPVSYRPRIGQSKVSGTMRGVWGAGTKILYTIFAAALTRQARSRAADRLVVFTRLPVPGATKTRMIPALGPEGAAELQHAMTTHTLAWSRAPRKSENLELDVRFTGGEEYGLRAAFGDVGSYSPQGGGDLGDRMHRTFVQHFAAGAKRVVIIGTDCPQLNQQHVNKALHALQKHDVVLGPAADGGYYLIALRRAAPQLFQQMLWGSAEVLQMTLARAREIGLSVKLLDELHDVDRPEDLPIWKAVTPAETR